MEQFLMFFPQFQTGNLKDFFIVLQEEGKDKQNWQCFAERLFTGV